MRKCVFLSYFCFLWLKQISVQLTESQAISHFCWFRYFFLINESLWNWRRILWFHPVAFEMLPQWHSILPAGICRYNNGLVFGHVFRIYKLWILIEDESKWIWRDSVFFFPLPFQTCRVLTSTREIQISIKHATTWWKCLNHLMLLQTVRLSLHYYGPPLTSRRRWNGG